MLRLESCKLAKPRLRHYFLSFLVDLMLNLFVIKTCLISLVQPTRQEPPDAYSPNTRPPRANAGTTPPRMATPPRLSSTTRCLPPLRRLQTVAMNSQMPNSSLRVELDSNISEGVPQRTRGPAWPAGSPPGGRCPGGLYAREPPPARRRPPLAPPRTDPRVASVRKNIAVHASVQRAGADRAATVTGEVRDPPPDLGPALEGHADAGAMTSGSGGIR